MTDRRLTMMEAWGKLLRVFVAIVDVQGFPDYIVERSAINVILLMNDIDAEMRSLVSTDVAHRAFDMIQERIIARTLESDEERTIFRNRNNIRVN